jgi:AhpD family alkylhydroperoxidase
MNDNLHDEGVAVRRAVLGDAHVDRATDRATEFTAPFQERSMITLAVLCALRCEDELAMHVRAALRNGLTAVEIREARAQQVLAEEGARS